MSVENLTAQWYDAVVQACRLDPSSFQLVQGSMVVGDFSSSLWKIFDAIPPDSINHLFNPAQTNQFSAQYGALLTVLKPNGVVEPALDLWNESGGFGAEKAYNVTIEDLQTKIKRAPSVSFSTKMESDTVPQGSRSWAKGKQDLSSALSEIAFLGFAVSALEDFAASGSVSVDVKFEHIMTFPGAPLAKKSSFEPILQQFKPWYVSTVLSRAFNSHQAWKQPRDYKQYFGKDGSMLRVASSLVVVDGITSKVSAAASLSDDKDSEFRIHLPESGFFPFLGLNVSEAEGSATIVTEEPGRETVILESPVGIPLILGVNVTPIADAI